MDPTEAAAALAANPTPPAGHDLSDTGIAPGDALPGAIAETETPPDMLSPAVRRLIRQYDLDVAGIHGTGPSGRIRVSDVIGILGSRAAEPPPRLVEPARHLPPDADAENTANDSDDSAGEANDAATDATASPAAGAAPAMPISTVFDCDLGRVLSHRKRQRSQNADLLLTSYFLVACTEAQQSVPELTDGRALCFGVQLATADGLLYSLLVAAGDSAPNSLDERLPAVDASLRAGATTDFAATNLLIHHYGASGSLIATPTPIGAGHVGSIGIGRVRREIVVRTADDGEEAPRVSARCYLSLTFQPERIELHRANQFMAHAVRILEQWPE